MSLSKIPVYIPGLALIFHDENKRIGDLADVRKLKNVLESINCKVEIYPEIGKKLNFGDINATIANLKSPQSIEKLKKLKYIIIAHFSHGTTDDHIVLPGEEYPASWRDMYLEPLFEIEELKEKLKWIILQKCRGEYDEIILADTDDDGENLWTEWFLVSMACSPGTNAFRVTTQDNTTKSGTTHDEKTVGDTNENYEIGSIYITNLTEKIRLHAADTDLIEILKKTYEAVKKDSADLCEKVRANNDPNCPADGAIQVPVHNDNIQKCKKKFYFTEGFTDVNDI